MTWIGESQDCQVKAFDWQLVLSVSMKLLGVKIATIPWLSHCIFCFWTCTLPCFMTADCRQPERMAATWRQRHHLVSSGHAVHATAAQALRSWCWLAHGTSCSKGSAATKRRRRRRALEAQNRHFLLYRVSLGRLCSSCTDHDDRAKAPVVYSYLSSPSSCQL
jgi:hypothetical protein